MDYNEQAKRLLPCAWVIMGSKDEPQKECSPTDPGCTPCAKRPAVAAALAEAEARGVAQWKSYNSYPRLYSQAVEEISRLTAEVEGLKAALSTMHEGCISPSDAAQLRAERDAAVVQGLEIAKRACVDWHSVLAIRAEIEKRKAGDD